MGAGALWNRRFLVAVLVAVGFQLFCFLMQRRASLIRLLSIAMNEFVRLCAMLCDTLQNRQNGTQNPPIARSWGFDPPLPAPLKSAIYEINASSDAFFSAQTVPKLT
jgi:hypothetical protein